MLARILAGWPAIAAAALAMGPGLALGVGLYHMPDAGRAMLFGMTIVAAAFLLSWAAEVSQLDFSQGLSLALLALIAVLPEYVVDASFAWLAAEDPVFAGYAIANMTGANRLLIGMAWPLVLVIAFLRFRRFSIDLEKGHGLELVVLLAATLYAFIIVAKGDLGLLDLAVLFSLFAFYVWQVARMPAGEPHLVGPARRIAAYPAWTRRLITLLLAAAAAGAVLLVAKPFAKALVATGVDLGIDEFLLVQWLAPLASEAPEFVVVVLFAWRGLTTAALGTLISSKINQWTLLVAMLPLIYAIALGRPDALPLDPRQQEEVLLTAAQSLLAVALLLDLRLSLVGAALLFTLFTVQLIFSETRVAVTAIYLGLTPFVLLRSRARLAPALRELPLPWLKNRGEVAAPPVHETSPAGREADPPAQHPG